MDLERLKSRIAVGFGSVEEGDDYLRKRYEEISDQMKDIFSITGAADELQTPEIVLGEAEIPFGNIGKGTIVCRLKRGGTPTSINFVTKAWVNPDNGSRPPIEIGEENFTYPGMTDENPADMIQSGANTVAMIMDALADPHRNPAFALELHARKAGLPVTQ